MRLLAALVLALMPAAVLPAKQFTVLVFNVENLTAADGHTQSEEYTISRYSRAHLLTKMNNIAKVVARFEEGRGPDVILFQEIERDFLMDQYIFDHAGMLRHFAGQKIEDMLGHRFDRDVASIPVEGLLLKTFEDRGMGGYRVAAADDGVDIKTRRHITQLNVVFTRFPITAVRTHLLADMPATLEVQLQVDGASLYVFNNYWKGDAISEKDEDRRIAAAKIIRERIDEIFSVNPNADIIVAGDFNSFYNQGQRLHLRKTGIGILGSQNNEAALRGPADFYNLWYELPGDQRGSGIYQNVWSTFMQMMVSRGLYDFRGVQYVDDSFGIAEFPDLNMTEDGRPWRWSFKGLGAGFSDHFPLYARFTTVRNNRTDQYLALPTRPLASSRDGERR
jgi:endonuclease/exonuclease/phosphatase family metal-dependent hydrolase